MSRFDIDDDGEQHITWEMWQWNVSRALASKKGQAKLRELREALLVVPGHRLVDDKIATLEGDVCLIGAYAAYNRTLKGQTWAEATADLNQTFHGVTHWIGRDGREHTYEEKTDAWATQELGMRECGLNATLAWQLGFENDEGIFDAANPEERWQKAYEWVCAQIGLSEPTPAASSPEADSRARGQAG